ncbi:Dihydrofolate synthetase [Zancudomyces culisetae]|uniref:Dihydrofolate synthetase n=1 Tax=Zancudomyces culisetae TaxID=1213189 RepID=A0A1R1PGY8_ZANCU|nr:Dihydrofolate synthetase [Zancudomyces culisetae]|eukprot:OMH80207.1 Dihydrofolate synthetase [Zancudomyces culisetae]
MDLGLERIKHFLNNVLDQNPCRKLKIIHITGTNGKGSVCAFISSVLCQKLPKVGTFNSPHLVTVRDSIKINNKEISELDHARIVGCIRKKLEQLEQRFQLTNFEILVVEMLLYFVEQDVDIALLEVGVGGLKDATNVFDGCCSREEGESLNSDNGGNKNSGVTGSLIQCITNIGHDHIGLIGNNLTEITREKLGIVKRNSIVVIGPQHEQEVVDVITSEMQGDGILKSCKKVIALHKGDYDIKTLPINDRIVGLYDKKKSCMNNVLADGSDNGRKKNVEAGAGELKTREIPHLIIESMSIPLVLNGNHQADNAAVAYHVIQEINQSLSLGLNREDIYYGFYSTEWVGRLTWLSFNTTENRIVVKKFAPKRYTVNAKDEDSKNLDTSKNNNDIVNILVDGAHNVPAAQKVVEYINGTINSCSHCGCDRNKNDIQKRRVVYVANFTAGKNYKEIMDIIFTTNQDNSNKSENGGWCKCDVIREFWTCPFTQPDQMPWINCIDCAELVEYVTPNKEKYKISKSRMFENWQQIFKELVCYKKIGVANLDVVVFGSLYLVADLFREVQIKETR